MSRLTAVFVGIALAFCVSQSAPAAASPHRAAVSINYGAFTIDEETAPVGGVVNVEYERFFSDAIAFRVGAGGGYFIADENSYTAHGVVGFSYTIDNLKYVPYGTVGLGGLLISDERIDPGLDLYVEGGGGLDIMVDKKLAVGVTFKLEVQMSRVAFFTAGARVVYRFGD